MKMSPRLRFVFYAVIFVGGVGSAFVLWRFIQAVLTVLAE